MLTVSYLPYQHVPQNCEVTVFTVFNYRKKQIFVEMLTKVSALHRGTALRCHPSPTFIPTPDYFQPFLTQTVCALTVGKY